MATEVANLRAAILAKEAAERAAAEKAQAEAKAKEEAETNYQATAMASEVSDLRAEVARVKQLLNAHPKASPAPPAPPGTNPPPRPPMAPLPGVPSDPVPPSSPLPIPPIDIPGGHDPGFQDDTVYGVSKVLPHEVFDQLVPQSFSSELRTELQTLLPDVVSPSIGTFNNESTGGQEEIASSFINAFANHQHVGWQRRGGFVKADASWNTVSRVGLFKVKVQRDFTTLLYGYTTREREFVPRLSSRIRGLLHHHGYSEVEARVFAESSRYAIMCNQAHSLYGRLLRYIDSEIVRHDWKSIKPHIDMFALDLVGFRDDVSRLGMWVNTYVYLRNLYQRNWWSVERQALVNRALLESATGSTEDTSPTSGCPHCKATHTGIPCPLQHLSRTQAKKVARAAKNKGGSFVKAVKSLLAEREDGTEDKDE